MSEGHQAGPVDEEARALVIAAPAGLLDDELHLLVHPIAVRKGMRLFDEGEESIPL